MIKPQKESLSLKQILAQTYARYQSHRQLIESLYSLPQCLAIVEPYLYLLSGGGKKIRIMMAIMISDMFQAELKREVVQIGGLVELLHCASLIVDDIEDSSIERRGEPCAHLKYGMDRSINAANLIYFLPFNRLLLSLPSQLQPAILQVYADEMICCHLGQSEDVLVHKTKTVEQLPSFEEYIRMTSAKTGSLMRMMVKMIGVVLEISRETIDRMIKVMDCVGISFQVTDDILNVTSREHAMGKGIVCEDLHEKKFTVIVHHLRDNTQFISLFMRANKSQSDIKRMLQIIDGSNAIQMSKKIAEEYAEQALRYIDEIECKYDKERFKMMVKFIVERGA